MRGSYNQSHNQEREKKEFEEKVLLLRRVSKKTTGGNNISFSALVVVGNQKGKVGLGIGRAIEVPAAIQKAVSHAKKKMITIEIKNESIVHDIRLKFRAADIFLKPAPLGAGLKVGSVVRSILNAAGITNASGKILGSRNKITNAYAVMMALAKIKKSK